MDTESIPICRVCMQKSAEFVDFDMPLENEDEEDTCITYLDFFFECTRIEVEPHEGESQCFCLPCGNELRSFYKFVKIAEMTDTILKAKHSSISIKSSTINNNLTSPKINEFKHKKNVEDLLNIKNNTEEIVKGSDEANEYLLEESIDRKTVTNYRLIKLQVEPAVILNKINETGEDHVMKNIESKLNKRKKSKTGPAECAFCHEILRNQKRLDEHLIEEHQRRTKPCKICGKMIIRMRAHLLIHEREKQSTQRPKIECSICFRMISKQTISRHIRQVHHREIRKHKCTECSQTFADAHKLSVHILKGHISRMSIKCPLCSRIFANRNSLSNHLRVHPCLEHLSG